MKQNMTNFSLMLKTFDELKLDNIHERRMACKPLHDYFIILIRFVGVNLCELEESIVKMSSLKTRWENIKNCLEYVDEPKYWDEIVDNLHKIRVKVEHQDYFDPSKEILLNIRKETPNFKEWIIKASGDYKLQSKNYTFIDTFYKHSNHYINEAKIILSEFGEKTPFAVRDEFEFTSDTYQQLPILMEYLQKRIQLSKLQNIEVEDLENLIKIIKIVSNFRANEETLMSTGVCPKCGGDIKETQTYFGGGTEYQPEPDGVFIRIGCQECDYEIEQDTFNI
jgi:hypothetical protein